MTKMPAKSFAAATGHELTDKSVLFDYIDPSWALMLLAATVLAKFPIFPHGRILEGPKASSMQSLISVNADALQAMIFDVFHITAETHKDLQVQFHIHTYT